MTVHDESQFADARPSPRPAGRGPRSAAVVPEDRWATGEPALRLLLNGPRRWEADR